MARFKDKPGFAAVFMPGGHAPAEGEIFYDGRSSITASEAERQRMRRGVGVLFQGGALFSSMTLLPSLWPTSPPRFWLNEPAATVPVL